MKTYTKLLLLLLPFFVIWTLLPLPRRMQFAQLSEDCYDHALDVYDRLADRNKAINVLFLGSSRTLNAVDDHYLSEQTGRATYNAAYCRLGRNLEFSLLQLALENHPIKTVVVEVGYQERNYSHPVFPFLAAPSEVLAAPFAHDRWLSDTWKAAVYRTELLQHYYLGKPSLLPGRTNTYAYGGLADTLTVFPEVAAPTLATISGAPARVPTHYLQRIKTLCADHAVQLHFLYLPAFKHQQQTPIYASFYEQSGKLLLPTSATFAPNNWADDNHLNRSGARALSEWLLTVLQPEQ